MSSNINWVGNRVLDPGVSPKMPGPAPASASAQQKNFTQQSVPAQQSVLPDDQTQQGPPPSTEQGYIPHYLASNIGKKVRAEFIIGNNQYVDKTGVLSEVGINYFVLDDVNSRTKIMCDLYSVKFVTMLMD